MKSASRTKIIATLGPSSSSKEVVRKMAEEGIDVCRLNFSHGTHEDHLKMIKMVREINRECGTNIAIMADLQGPKLRIGEIEDNAISLDAGDVVHFVNFECIGTREQIYMNYRQLPLVAEPGQTLSADDGKIRFLVTDTNKADKVTLKVLSGGILSSRKGVNLPETTVNLPALTSKDVSDARFAMSNGADYLALSFVRKADDLEELRQLIREEGKNTRLIAKIEKPEALREFDGILQATDAVMVARGDLGVEVEFEMVPLIQKEIIKKCLSLSKPVIVATQMMEGMITGFRPTRAEAADVANAVLDGADALMLSGETSVGHDPVEVIRSMQKIISYTEESAYPFYRDQEPLKISTGFLTDSICRIASNLAKQTNAAGIICFTRSGESAIRLAAQRPKARVFAITSNEALLPELSLVWGIQPVLANVFPSIEEAIKESVGLLKARGFINEKDALVHIGNIPPSLEGEINMVRSSYA